MDLFASMTINLAILASIVAFTFVVAYFTGRAFGKLAAAHVEFDAAEDESPSIQAVARQDLRFPAYNRSLFTSK